MPSLNIKQQIFPYIIAFYNYDDKFTGSGFVAKGPSDIIYMLSCYHVIAQKKYLRGYLNFSNSCDINQKTAKYFCEVSENKIRTVKKEDTFFYKIDVNTIKINPLFLKETMQDKN